MTNPQVFKEISAGKTLEQPTKADEKVFSIMKSCWETVPDLRPPMKIILNKLVEISQQISEKAEEKQVLSFYTKKKDYHPVYLLTK